jgi:non-ribosomal peptide synthetase-like protein
LLVELLAALMVLPMIPLMVLWSKAFFKGGVLAGAVSLVVSVPLAVVFYCLFIAGIKRLFLNGIRPGTYPVESAAYLRKWFSDDLMKLSKALLLPLYTTIYLPPWLRMLGAKIGRRAELSTVWQFSPELIDVGEESFFADGSIIGGKRFYRGVFEIGINRIGRRSFVGNSAILPVGASLGSGCLLGVQSIPPPALPNGPHCTADGTEWLGSPSFSLPHRHQVGGFDDAVTFRPTRKLIIQRSIVDALRILIPGYVGLSATVAGVLALYYDFERFGFLGLFLALPLIGIVLGLYATLTVAALKKAVMGTFKPVIVPLWSMYVWLNEMVNGAYESLMAPAIAPFLGTPFIAPLLRLIGCRIGKNTYIETTLFSEFDLVEIGDYAALNFGAVIQNHLFEDRVMKSSYLKIGEGCSVGNMAVILYDSEMKEGSSIGPLSLLMKGETLSAKTRSYGIPTVQMTDDAPESPWVREPLSYHDVAPLGLRTRLRKAKVVVTEKTAEEQA